jgi:hypothetical protein
LNCGEDVEVGGESTKTELEAELSEGSDSTLEMGECSACCMISLPRDISSAMPSKSRCQNFSFDRDRLTNSRTYARSRRGMLSADRGPKPKGFGRSKPKLHC